MGAVLDAAARLGYRPAPPRERPEAPLARVAPPPPLRTWERPAPPRRTNWQRPEPPRVAPAAPIVQWRPPPPLPPAVAQPGASDSTYFERERLRRLHHNHVRSSLDEAERLRREHAVAVQSSTLEADRIRAAHEAHIRRAEETRARLDNAIARVRVRAPLRAPLRAPR